MTKRTLSRPLPMHSGAELSHIQKGREDGLVEVRLCLERHRLELEELLLSCLALPKSCLALSSQLRDEATCQLAVQNEVSLSLPKTCLASSSPLGDEATSQLDAQDGAPDAGPIEMLKDAVDATEAAAEPCEEHSDGSIGHETNGQDSSGHVRREPSRCRIGPEEGLDSLERFRNKTNLVGKDGLSYQDNWCTWIIKLPKFDHVCALFIIVSSFAVGVELELRVESNSAIFDVLQYVFLAFFTVELFLRMGARGKMFYRGMDRAWNAFDCFCVFSSYFEIIFSALMPKGEEGSVLLITRTIRVVRIARILRVVKFLGKLRMMVFTMFGAMSLLGWAVLLLLMMIYMFAVCFTEAAKPLIASDAPHSNKKLLDDYFGTIVRSMLCLFQAITNGVSWRDALEILAEINALYETMFLVYICIVVFTILNVITGLCCDYAIQNALADKDDAIRDQLKDKEKWQRQFSLMFAHIDNDNSGEVSGEELKEYLHDEEFQAYLSHLNISVDNALDMFEVLDQDGDGSISIDEFVTGCMRVKGQAKTIDIMKLRKELAQLRNELMTLAK